MFIIKAEIHADAAPQPYTLLTANRICVRAHQGAQSNGVAPDFEVELMDAQVNTFETLYVGKGLDHYSAIYVMNERGKTVESVYPRGSYP